jgi:hypothetical protein
MAKRHRGFGGKLKFIASVEVRQTKNIDNEKRKLIIKIFGLAKC